MACNLLLSLGLKDFPVDTNVGRICARLGWIPLDSEQALEVGPLLCLWIEIVFLASVKAWTRV